MKLHEIRSAVALRRPLIHCITNPISINQCANAILAVGARPIMAEHPAEVQEITQTADALLLNLGNITDARMQAMPLSLAIAREKGIPVVLDAVGVACSALRRDYALKLLKTGGITAVKGNYSEICALQQASCRSSGVDADASIGEASVCRVAGDLAREHRAIILASGKTDIIAGGASLLRIRNGSPQLAGVTGTGCMLGALCGTYLSVCPDMDAMAAACTVLGVGGQMAETPHGSGSFMVRLMDALSTLTDAQIEKYKDMEEIQLENL